MAGTGSCRRQGWLDRSHSLSLGRRAATGICPRLPSCLAASAQLSRRTGLLPPALRGVNSVPLLPAPLRRLPPPHCVIPLLPDHLRLPITAPTLEFTPLGLAQHRGWGVMSKPSSTCSLPCLVGAGS